MRCVQLLQDGEDLLSEADGLKLEPSLLVLPLTSSSSFTRLVALVDPELSMPLSGYFAGRQIGGR